MRTLVVMAVLIALVLSAGSAFAAYGYGGENGSAAKPQVRAKVGWFMPNEGSLDSDIAFGLDFVKPYAAGGTLVKQAWDGYLTIDRLRATDTTVEWTSWDVLVGVNLDFAKNFYYGAGIGFARSTLERAGSPDRNESDFAWEVGAGAKFGLTAFAEVKYRDGGEDGNTGVIVYLGARY